MEDDFQDFLDVDSQSIAESTYNPPTIPKRIQNKIQKRGAALAEYRLNNINNADQDELDFNIRSSNNRNQKLLYKKSLKRSVVDENDQIQILGMSNANSSAMAAMRQSGQNISNFSTDSELRGVEKIALKKRTVNKFLRRVEKTKKRFVEYQTAKKEAKLKNRLGIPQSEKEKQQLEEFKLQSSQYFNQSELDQDYYDQDEEEDQQYEDQDEVQSQCVDQCKSIQSRGWSQPSRFSIKSAPTPYLAQTSRGPVIRSYNQHPHQQSPHQNNIQKRTLKNKQRNKVGVQPKDFKKKDDFVFFDLFTLYAQNYMGKNKKKQQMIDKRGEQIIEQDDLQLQSQIFE